VASAGTLATQQRNAEHATFQEEEEEEGGEYAKKKEDPARLEEELIPV
jgi:hypothetical protein